MVFLFPFSNFNRNINVEILQFYFLRHLIKLFLISIIIVIKGINSWGENKLLLTICGLLNTTLFLLLFNNMLNGSIVTFCL